MVLCILSSWCGTTIYWHYLQQECSVWHLQARSGNRPPVWQDDPLYTEQLMWDYNIDLLTAGVFWMASAGSIRESSPSMARWSSVYWAADVGLQYRFTYSRSVLDGVCRLDQEIVPQYGKVVLCILSSRCGTTIYWHNLQQECFGWHLQARSGNRPPVWQGGPLYTELQMWDYNIDLLTAGVFWMASAGSIRKSSPSMARWSSVYWAADVGLQYTDTTYSRSVLNGICRFDQEIVPQYGEMVLRILRSRCGTTIYWHYLQQECFGWRLQARSGNRPPVWQGGPLYTGQQMWDYNDNFLAYIQISNVY